MENRALRHLLLDTIEKAVLEQQRGYEEFKEEAQRGQEEPLTEEELRNLEPPYNKVIMDSPEQGYSLEIVNRDNPNQKSVLTVKPDNTNLEIDVVASKGDFEYSTKFIVNSDDEKLYLSRIHETDTGETESEIEQEWEYELDRSYTDLSEPSFVIAQILTYYPSLDLTSTRVQSKLNEDR